MSRLFNIYIPTTKAVSEWVTFEVSEKFPRDLRWEWKKASEWQKVEGFTHQKDAQKPGKFSYIQTCAGENRASMPSSQSELRERSDVPNVPCFLATVMEVWANVAKVRHWVPSPAASLRGVFFIGLWMKDDGNGHSVVRGAE